MTTPNHRIRLVMELRASGITDTRVLAAIERVPREIFTPSQFRDQETVVTSIRKTGRGVIVHEAAKTCGLGAEIIALINEKAFLSLQAPIERVTGFDIPVPLPKTEHYYLPNPKRIIMAVKKVMSF